MSAKFTKFTNTKIVKKIKTHTSNIHIYWKIYTEKVNFIVIYKMTIYINLLLSKMPESGLMVHINFEIAFLFTDLSILNSDYTYRYVTIHSELNKKSWYVNDKKVNIIFIV